MPLSSGNFFAYHGPWAPGVRMFRQLSFAAKACLLSLAFMPLVVLLVLQTREADLESRAAREAELRHHVEIAVSIIDDFNRQALDGLMTREQAQERARKRLGSLRYAGREYFWINDLQPRMVMHPFKPELDGQSLADLKDPDGLRLFVRMAEIARAQGGGYVGYKWARPGSETAVDKVSYVQLYEPWGWVVGTGVYVDDLRAASMRRWEREGLVALLVLGAVTYLFISFYKVMDGGLKETRRHLRAMTDGDLTTSPQPWGRDEAAALMFDLRRMQESLRGIVADVRGASDDISQASSEISSATMDLSRRTEANSASLEQVASAMEQFGSTVRASAVHAGEAARIAADNVHSAEQAGSTVSRLTATMDEIGAAATGIDAIVATIESIAFQTNILALNAAIEAARAGDHGRGFAVVASEVRALAQRSSLAAKQITKLVEDSVAKTGAGAQVVREAGQAIREMSGRTVEVGGLIRQIADSAREQATVVAQVSGSTQSLDDSTRQNAAMVEQAAAASASLRDRAQGLTERVARFVLEK